MPDACTPEEAAAYRKRLREIGKVAFVEETIGRGTITARKLLTAFGIVPPSFLEDAPDEAFHPLLALAISREYAKRQKLPEYNTIEDAVELLKKSKNIIVITGAGVCATTEIPSSSAGHLCTNRTSVFRSRPVSEFLIFDLRILDCILDWNIWVSAILRKFLISASSVKTQASSFPLRRIFSQRKRNSHPLMPSSVCCKIKGNC